MSTTTRPSGSAFATLVIGLLLAASPLAAGESRWYVVGMLGRAGVDTEVGDRTVDDDDLSAGFELGYSLGRHFALELGYRDFGSFPAFRQPCDDPVCPLSLPELPLALEAPAEAEFTGFTLAAVPLWPVTERFALYGKLGVLAWEGEVESPGAVRPLAEPSESELLAGAGGRYTLPNGFGLLAEVELSDLVTTVGVGTSWRF